MAEAAHLQFVLSVLNHAGVIGVNWQSAAEENGIGYARNCTQKFKDTVNKYGYTFQNNKLVKTENAVPEAPPKVKKARKPRATKAATTKTPAAKKRKAVEMEELEDSEKDNDDKKVLGQTK